MKKIKWTNLLIFVVAAELVGVLSALFAGNFNDFYSTLSKPPLSPPGWVFAAVWSVLYALMGISAYLISESDAEEFKKKKALAIYSLQLALNFLWSIFFFRLKQPALALVILLILIAALVLMILVFRKLSTTAALINIPYLGWTLFALYLNIAFLILN